MRLFLTLLALILLWSCDPVKRSLRKKAEIDAAIAQWVLDNPKPSDTVYLPGVERVRYDTIVNENIYVDTIRIKDTVYIRKTRWQDIIKTIQVTDTMYQVLSDHGAAQHLRSVLEQKNAELSVKSAANKSLTWAIVVLSLCLIFMVGIRLMK
jgi:hypothetical protein